MFTLFIQVLLCYKLCKRVFKQCHDTRAARALNGKCLRRPGDIVSQFAILNEVSVGLAAMVEMNEADHAYTSIHGETMARMKKMFKEGIVFLKEYGDVSDFENEWREIVHGPVTAERLFVYNEVISHWFQFEWNVVSLRGRTLHTEAEGSLGAFISLREKRRTIIQIREDYDSGNTETTAGADGIAETGDGHWDNSGSVRKERK